MQIAKDGKPLLFLLAAFVLSRFFYYHFLGLKFDISPIYGYWQYLDLVLLRNDLWRSLRYLHSQPPLFNLGLGLLLKAFPISFREAGQAIYMLFGLSLMIATYGAMVTLRVNRWLAAALAAVYVCMPSTALYEAWLCYTIPVAVFFAFAIWLAALYARFGSARYAAGFVTSLVMLALLRASFHLLWVVAFATAAVALKQRGRRNMVLAMAPSLLLLLVVHANVWVKFSTLALSESFANLTLSQVILFSVPETDLYQLKNDGKISGLAMVKPFSSVLDYRAIVPALGSVENYGVPALIQVRKFSGALNMNNALYLEASRLQLRDALIVLREHPRNYFKKVGSNIAGYFSPKETIFSFYAPQNLAYRNFKRLGSFFAIMAPLAGLLPWLIPALLFVGLGQCLTSWRKKNFPHFFVLTFIAGTILTQSIVYVLLSPADHCRYRAEIDPGYVVLLGLAMQAGVNLWKRRATNYFQ